MNIYIFTLGLIVLLITSADLVNTSISVRGAGYMSRRISIFIWNMLLRITRKTGKQKVLEFGGLFILLSIIINWLILIWFSATLMFVSQTDSLKNVETNTSTTIASKIFYTGYTLSTLGLGDIEPNGAFWEILTSILSFLGLVLISIAITFLIPVVTAEIEKRKVSVYITTLGCSTEEILTNYWNGADFKDLEQPFLNLTNMIILHAQNHKVYSVLHFFHSSNKKESFVLNLTNLDEALTILLHRVPEEQRPAINVLKGLRKAISSYLVTLPVAYVVAAEVEPPHLSHTSLGLKEIPIMPYDELIITTPSLANRRKLLLGLVNDGGWKWTDLKLISYEEELSIMD